MRRRWLVAALLVILVVPAPVMGQGSVVDPLDGVVRVGQRGDTDDVELTPVELETATRRVSGLHVGLVMADPAATETGAASEGLQAITDAATARLAQAGVSVDTCLVGPERDASSCIEQVFQSRELIGVLIVGDFGDLTEATAMLVRNRVVPVGVGGSILAEESVSLDVNPVSAATAQAQAAGRSLSVRAPSRTGNALIAAGSNPRRDDPVREAGEAALRRTAPKVRVTGRVGPVELRTVEDLAPLLVGSRPIKVVIGEGLILDGIDAVGLESLPPDLRLVAWRCTATMTSMLDAASRLRGCVEPAHAAAGEAAANVILAIKTSRDVPATIEIPVYVYRGTVPVGPGRVQLGRRINQAPPPLTDAEMGAAAANLSGRTIGIVLPVASDSREPEHQRIIREGIEATAAAIGATVATCVGRRAAAAACVRELTAEGVAAIVPIATGGNLASAVSAAIQAGVMVVGVNETRLGDAGGVYVQVNPNRVARLAGRMAGNYADRTWVEQQVDAVVMNDSGARADDSIASVLERALVQTGSSIQVAARLASRTPTQQRAAVNALVRRHPGARVLVGPNAADLAPLLIRRRAVNPELVIYGHACTPDMVAAVDAGVGTGGRLRGCVDTNPAGTARLASEVLVRLAGGAEVREINDVQVIPYEPGFRG